MVKTLFFGRTIDYSKGLSIFLHLIDGLILAFKGLVEKLVTTYYKKNGEIFIYSLRI
jgi:hypothetical protein